MADVPPKPRLRFSLLTSLLLVTIVATAITIYLLYAELVPLRAELRRLRDEVGELSIDDERKLHAILMPQANPGEFLYKWRLWIPAGRRYQVRFTSISVPKTGFPKSYGAIPLTPGEHWVAYHVFRDPDSDRWHDMLYTQDVSVSGDYQDWPDWMPRTGDGSTVGDSTVAFEHGRIAELARWHVARGPSGTPITYPSAGYLIWLEPLP